MRKLFLASMLTLGMAGAAFANNDKTETSEVITPKVETTVKVEKETKKVKGCESFLLSCGISGTICSSNPSGDVRKMDLALYY